METVLLMLQILLINIVLSGDNAVVIAMASKNLAPAQRVKAIWWGAFGAVALRIALTFAAVYMLKLPFIQLFGSLLLLYIAVKLLTEDESHSQIKAAAGVAAAIWTIIVADLVMSLDNVLAVAAVAKNNVPVLIAGIAISIPLIIWGSGAILRLLERYPVLIYVGAGLLGFAAGEMMIADKAVIAFMRSGHEYLHWLLPAAFPALVMGAGAVKRLSAKSV